MAAINAINLYHDAVDLESPLFTKTLRYIVPQEWELYRPMITRLYQTEGKSLKEVMEILELNRGLKATEKMYKIRIKAWGLDKKNKKHEIEAILRQKAQRNAAGKDSQFTLRGRPVDLQSVEKYIKRNRISVDHLVELQVGSPQLPLDLMCLTPPRIASPILAPESFRKVEIFLTSFKASVTGEIELVFPYHGAEVRPLSKAYTASWEASNQFIRDIDDGIANFKMKRNDLAGAYWRRAFLQVDQLLMSSCTQIVIVLMASIHLLYLKGWPEVAVMLRQHLVNTTKTGGSGNHRRHQLVTTMTEFEDGDLQELIPRASMLAIEGFMRNRNCINFTPYINLWCDQCWSHSKWSTTPEFTGTLPSYISKLEADHGRLGRATITALLVCGCTLLASKLYVQAQKFYHSVVARISEIKCNTRRAFYQARFFSWLGQAQYMLNKNEPARTNLENALNMNQQVTGRAPQSSLSSTRLCLIYRMLSTIAEDRYDKEDAAKWAMLRHEEEERLRVKDKESLELLGVRFPATAMFV